MTTIAERILEAIRSGPLDDDVLAQRLELNQRQTVNQVARRLEAQGRLRRFRGPNGKLVNALPHVEPPVEPAPPAASSTGLFSEDDVKRAVSGVLEEMGFELDVAWGRTRGIDIHARHADGRRYIIEAKGEVTSDQQQGSYFLGALGELLQRMDDPDATYALALPRNRRYVGLVERLPDLVWERLGLRVFWLIRDTDRGDWVGEQDTPRLPVVEHEPLSET